MKVHLRKKIVFVYLCNFGSAPVAYYFYIRLEGNGPLLHAQHATVFASNIVKNIFICQNVYVLILIPWFSIAIPAKEDYGIAFSISEALDCSIQGAHK